MKKILATLVGTICALLVFAGTGAAIAKAAPPGEPPDQRTSAGTGQASITDDDIAYVRDQLASFGVNQATQDSLIKNLLHGVPWQSMLPGALPVSETENSDGQTRVVVSTYADGSIAVSQTSLPIYPNDQPAGIQPRGVSGCAASGSSGYAWYYTNCKADVNLVLVEMWFNFNYENVSGTGARITGYGAYGYYVIGSSYSNFRFNYMNSAQTDLRLSANADFAYQGFPVGWTAYMGVQVSGSTATTYHN